MPVSDPQGMGVPVVDRSGVADNALDVSQVWHDDDRDRRGRDAVRPVPRSGPGTIRTTSWGSVRGRR
jgi:hypothetical protein